ncbi:MAG: DUF4062 domain-containing protein [Rhodocyclaceae bacterium]|nr:DUF4062 domain-containing protein [Rhodocyclaceae bacterium]
MSYQATVFKVMIASPGDVAAERNVIREVITEWNNVNADSRRTVLLSIGWETHSVPEMGNRPQAIINKQILGCCDLLVGVFWTRLGTETGAYQSGTVEEIEEHLKAGKPAMLYFSDVPVVMGSVNEAQYARLKGFRDDCMTRGLLESYSSVAEFREKFYRHLQIKLNGDEYFSSGTQSAELDTLPPRLADQLSSEAQILLKDAVGADGQILCLLMLGGLTIQVGGRNFTEGADARSQAMWEGAVQELERLGLISPLGNKREIFKITRDGFDAADQIVS